MAKDKVLLKLLDEYKHEHGNKKSAFEYAIGCELYEFDYEKQLRFKSEHIRRLFQAKGFDVQSMTVHPSPEVIGYRNKMEYSFGDVEIGGDLNLGMHMPGRYYDIISTTDLYIVDDDFNKIVDRVQAYARQKGYKKFYKKDGSGLLRNLIVRKAKFTGEILIGISTAYDDTIRNSDDNIIEVFKEFDRKDFVRELLSIDLNGNIVGIMHLKNNSVADVVKQGEHDEMIYGRDYYVEKILGLEFKVSFFSFFQTNSAGAEILYNRVKDIVRKLQPKMALDLFCGTGTISQILSKEVDQLIGVEIIEDAVKMANENAQLNGIDNCTYIAGDVFKVLKEWEGNPDLIVLDPPRSGVNPKALKKIIEFGVDNILYVSCNPRTLVIDYEILHESGYEIKSIEAVDLYPCTKHVECIVLMSSK